MLLEKPEGGSYTDLGSESVSFTNKPEGMYSYVAAYYGCQPGPYGTPICDQYSSDIATVRVVDSLPARDPVSTQLEYDYEARTGDINSDGATDIFIRRTSGGEPYNGVVEEVILQQTSSGSFQSLVPSALQKSTASSWPFAGIEMVVEDFNVDGFADVLLKGVAAAVNTSGIPNQMVYAPGQLLDAEPLGVRAVDASLTEFVGNSLDYFVNPNYYSQNVPITYYSVTI